MTNVFVEYTLLYPDAQRPEYATAGAAGMDLSAYVPRAQGRQPPRELRGEQPGFFQRQRWHGRPDDRGRGPRRAAGALMREWHLEEIIAPLISFWGFIFWLLETM